MLNTFLPLIADFSVSSVSFVSLDYRCSHSSLVFPWLPQSLLESIV